MYCHGIQEIWKNSEWWQLLKNLKGLKTKDLLYSLESGVPEVNFEEICTKLWGLWKDRCNFIHRALHRYPIFTKRKNNHWTEAYIDAFRKVREKVSHQTQPLTKSYTLDPQQKRKGCYMLHIDAAYKNHTLSCATGFAIKTLKRNYGR